MAINSIDVLSWIIVIVITTIVIYQGMQKYDAPGASQKGQYLFYGLTILTMMVAFSVLAFLKTGYSYNSATETCTKGPFGYWKYPTEEECLRSEKKDPITGMKFF